MRPRRTAVWYPAGTDFDTDPLVLGDQADRDAPFLAGMTGLRASSWDLVITKSPGVDGMRLKKATRKPNVIAVPVLLLADDYAGLQRKRSALISATRPNRGPGRLMLTSGLQTPDGDSRWCSAVKIAGLEGDEAPAASGPGWALETLKFQALGPWFSIDPVVAVWTGRAASQLFPLRFPLEISEPGVNETSPLEIIGDDESWPEYRLRGPFTRVRVTHPASGTFWEVNRPTSAAETLRLVTEPDQESLRLLVTVDDGATWVDQGSVYGSLHPDSWFVPLQFQEQLDIDAEGTTAAMQVQLTTWQAWGQAA